MRALAEYATLRQPQIEGGMYIIDILHCSASRIMDIRGKEG